MRYIQQLIPTLLRNLFIYALNSIPYIRIKIPTLPTSFYFLPDSFGAIEENLLIDNIYSKKDRLSDADTIIDLGAHNGCYKIYAILSAKQGAKIIAVEPDKNNYRILINNIGILKNIIISKNLALY